MLSPSPFNLPSDDQCRVIYNVRDLQHRSFLPQGCSVWQTVSHVSIRILLHGRMGMQSH